MTYQPFALKYRPQRFEEIVGQPHVSQTLQNAVAQGRIVHGYLFSGPRGTGKTSTARVLAKALNCEHGPTPNPCGECSNCVGIQEGRSMDVIEIDAASNRGIDEIRELRERVAYAPAHSRYKVYILDEAHMLTRDAANAFLKTLEEPPPQSYFILATTEPHRIIPTIMSRCQRFDFRAIPIGLIIERLREIAVDEAVQVDDAALTAIAVAANGAMRDAESILDQVVAYRGQEELIDIAVVRTVLGITEESLLARTADLIAQGDVPGLFGTVDELVNGGKDLVQFVVDLTEYFRNLLRMSMGAEVVGWASLDESELGQRRTQAEGLGSARILEVIHSLGETREKLRWSSQQPLLVEVMLAQLAPKSSTTGVAPVEAEDRRDARPTEPIAPVEAGDRRDARPTEPIAPAEAEDRPDARPTEPTAPVEAGDRRDACPTGPLTLEVVQAHWPALPRELKRSGDIAKVPIVTAGTPVAVSEDTIVLNFDEKHQFHYNKTRSDYRGIVESALKALFGRPVGIECRLGAPPEGETVPPEAAEAPVREEPGEEQPGDVVERTLQLFEGSQEINEE